MKELINFSTKFENIEQINPLISKYLINICCADVPANKYIFNKEVIEGMSTTIRGAGVYAYYLEKENQLSGHEDDIVKTKDGYRISGKPVAYGFSDPHQQPFWKEIDSKLWYCAFVYIWTGRNPEIADILENSVVMHSMEVAVDDEPDGFGNKRVKEALFLGFCLLQGIDPAFEGSRIEPISFSNDNSELVQLKQEYESFAHRYNSLDFKIPQAVKKAAQEGLDLRKEYGRGGTSVGLASARYLIKNTVVSPDKVRHIAKYFPRHAGDNLDDKTSNGWIAWQLWGGYAGRKWSTNLVEEMNKLDEKKLSYMSNDNDNNMLETFVNKEEIEEENSQIDNPPLEEGGNERVINKEKMSEFCNGQKYSKDEQEMCKYTYISHDDKNLFAYDNEFSKFVTIPYSVDEEDEEKFSVNMENVKGAKMSMRMMADDEENEDEVYMAISQMLSANQNVDAVAMQKMNEDAAAENKRLAEENNNTSQKFSTLETEHNTLKEEAETLRKFKADIEDQNKKFAVESTLKDVIEILPEEVMKECRDSAENFTLADIDIWKNEVQAKAFKFSKNIPEKRDYLWMALPNAGKPKKGNGLWD